jgi:hypothetical protein
MIAAAPSSGASKSDSDLAVIEKSVEVFVTALGPSDIESIFAYWKTERGVPPEFDRKLLAQVGEALERRLERNEMSQMRACFRDCVQRQHSDHKST